MLASLTPCLRQSSATGTPASCSFKNPDDLLFGETTALHVLVLAFGQNELQTGLSGGGNVKGRIADYISRMVFTVLGELGYLPFALPLGQLLFQLINRLYEQTSMIVATNLALSPRAKVLTSIALPQNTELTQQFVRTATLQMLDRARNRKVRRDRQQHVDMIPIDRTRMDRHLVRSCRIAQQFATSLADIAAQHLMTISRHPNQMIFAVPDRVAATLVHFHLNNLQRNHLDPRPPKGAGFADPLFGDSKRLDHNAPNNEKPLDALFKFSRITQS